ncbi:MAG TPA: hypothetical protein VKY40_05515 [Halanaerobiales bacterium]|nr:hypothetical protein [Halanaerobiales bacterium]
MNGIELLFQWYIAIPAALCIFFPLFLFLNERYLFLLGDRMYFSRFMVFLVAVCLSFSVWYYFSIMDFSQEYNQIIVYFFYILAGIMILYHLYYFLLVFSAYSNFNDWHYKRKEFFGKYVSGMLLYLITLVFIILSQRLPDFNLPFNPLYLGAGLLGIPLLIELIVSSVKKSSKVLLLPFSKPIYSTFWEGNRDYLQVYRLYYLNFIFFIVSLVR